MILSLEEIHKFVLMKILSPTMNFLTSIAKKSLYALSKNLTIEKGIIVKFQNQDKG